MATRAWIALGSNLGNRAGYLAGAREGLAATDGIRLAGVGIVAETLPLGGLPQPSFLNQMLLIETSLAPAALLDCLHRIERAAGRERLTRWCARTLDLDLVRYGNVLCDLPHLALPHPGLRDRDFWARGIAALETDG